MKQKYTYDLHCFIDNATRTSGLGASSKYSQLQMLRKFVKKYPYGIHVVLRKPDNNVIAFYHRLIGLCINDSKVKPNGSMLKEHKMYI